MAKKKKRPDEEQDSKSKKKKRPDTEQDDFDFAEREAEADVETPSLEDESFSLEDAEAAPADESVEQIAEEDAVSEEISEEDAVEAQTDLDEEPTEEAEESELSEEDAAAEVDNLLSDDDADDRAGSKTAVVDEDEEVAKESADEELAETDDEDGKDGGKKDKAAKGDDAEEEEPVRSKTTVLTMSLAVLNIMVACAFAFLLMMDFEKRQRWEYASFLHDLALEGLPLKEQDERLTASELLRSETLISQEAIAKEFQKRKSGVNVPAKDFQDVHEVLKISIKPSKLTKNLLNDMFKGVDGGPVATLEDEIKRVQGKLLADIESAAKKSADEAGKKSDPEQRQLLQKILLPMAYTTTQVEEEYKKIADSKDLAGLHVEAVQRKMYFDLLRVLQMYRHWNLEEKVLEKAVGADAIELKKMGDLVSNRIEDLLKERGKFYDLQRESIEKRANIGFLLVALANLRNASDGDLLYPRKKNETTKRLDPPRAVTVLGLIDYVKANDVLVAVVREINSAAVKRMEADRDGVAFKSDDKLNHLSGFVSEHQKLVERLVDQVADIEKRKKHVAELGLLLGETKQLLEVRQQDYEDFTKKLKDAQEGTTELVKILKNKEMELFAAQKQMAGIMEINAKLERDIAALESKLPKKLVKKGKSLP